MTWESEELVHQFPNILERFHRFKNNNNNDNNYSDKKNNSNNSLSATTLNSINDKNNNSTSNSVANNVLLSPKRFSEFKEVLHHIFIDPLFVAGILLKL